MCRNCTVQIAAIIWDAQIRATCQTGAKSNVHKFEFLHEFNSDLIWQSGCCLQGGINFTSLVSKDL